MLDDYLERNYNVACGLTPDGDEWPPEPDERDDDQDA